MNNIWDQRYAGEDYLFGTEPNDFLVSQRHLLKPGMSCLAVADGEGRNGVWLAQQGLQVLSVEASAVALEKAQKLARQRGVTDGTTDETTDTTTSHLTNPASEKLLAGHPKDAGQVIDETTSHLTKAASCQVIGYGYSHSAMLPKNGSQAAGYSHLTRLPNNASQVIGYVEFEQADLAQWQWGENRFDVVAAIFIQFAPPALREQMFAGIKRCLKPGGLLLLQGYTPRQLEYKTGGPPVAENMYTEALLRKAFSDMEISHLREHDDHIGEGTAHSGMSALIDLVARKIT